MYFLCFCRNLTSESLVYLTIEQALEDLIYFIDSYKKMTPGLENSKVKFVNLLQYSFFGHQNVLGWRFWLFLWCIFSNMASL